MSLRTLIFHFILRKFSQFYIEMHLNTPEKWPIFDEFPKNLQKKMFIRPRKSNLAHEIIVKKIKMVKICLELQF